MSTQSICLLSQYVYSVNLSTGLTCLLSRSLDLDIHPRRKAQLIESLDRLRGGLHDIDQSLVGSNFELLSRLLVNRRSGQNRVSLDSRRQRDRSVNLGMRSLGSIYNVLSTLIQDRVIISLHSNSDYLARHSTSSSLIAVPPSAIHGVDRAGWGTASVQAHEMNHGQTNDLRILRTARQHPSGQRFEKNWDPIDYTRRTSQPPPGNSAPAW